MPGAISPNDPRISNTSDTQLVTLLVVTQSCPILCDLMDCSPSGSSVPGVLQARILEWIAIPSPGDLPYPGIEAGSLALQTDSVLSESPRKPKSKGFAMVKMQKLMFSWNSLAFPMIKQMMILSTQAKRANLSFLCLFVLFTPSVNWMMSAGISEGHLLYPVYLFKC